jgi:hypothetical protein
MVKEKVMTKKQKDDLKGYRALAKMGLLAAYFDEKPSEVNNLINIAMLEGGEECIAGRAAVCIPNAGQLNKTVLNCLRDMCIKFKSGALFFAEGERHATAIVSKLNIAGIDAYASIILRPDTGGKPDVK